MKPRAPAPPLSRLQLRWIAALLACAQAPLILHMPAWIVALGSGLVVARIVMPERLYAPTALRRWLLPIFAVATAIGIRTQFGYFLARDPCVEFLYILLGIKFIEARTGRDGMLLVCLALFLSLAQFFYTQSIFAALAALPLLLSLGGTLAALRSGADARPWREQLASTARLVVQGVPLALLLFVLFPRLAAPLWGMPFDAGASTGLSDSMSPGSISQLSLSDAVAFRVDFAGQPPPPSQRYWRGPVLARFDGSGWHTAYRLQSGTPSRSSERPIEYTVTLEPHGKIWLFALEFVSTLPRPAVSDPLVGPINLIATLSYDQQLFARTPVTQTVRYTQRSILRDSFSARDDNPRENLRLPRTNPRTLAFAQDMRGRAASDSEYIRALLKWFRDEPFVYTLAPGQYDRDPVDAFLFDTRRGFCEHYAGAFVVLLRAAGIPARVVTGYQGGEMNPDGEYMIVRQSDAHAWAEAMIDGEWKRFDPTAAVAPSRIERGLGAALPASEPVPYLARLEMTWLKSLRLHWDSVNYQWQRGVVGFNLDRQRDFLRDVGLDGARPWQLVVLAAAASFLWGLAVLTVVRLRRSRVDAEIALWRSACRLLGRAGLVRRQDEGPLAYAARASGRWPQWAASFQRVANAYAFLRYGPPGPARGKLLRELETGVDDLPSARALGRAAK